MGIWRKLQAGAMMLAATLVCGCFAVTAPLIPPGGGEDVGAVLRYQVFFVSPSPDQGTVMEFRRAKGTSYELYFGDPDGALKNYPDERGATLIRRAGDRRGEPIFLIQVDLQNDIAIAFVAQRKDGMGIQALFDCQNPAVAKIALQHGITLSCVSSRAGQYFSNLQTRSGKIVDLLSFFADARAAGLIEWEDEAGVSLFQDISRLAG